jgi:hypothetical protein
MISAESPNLTASPKFAAASTTAGFMKIEQEHKTGINAVITIAAAMYFAIDLFILLSPSIYPFLFPYNPNNTEQEKPSQDLYIINPVAERIWERAEFY